MLKRSFLSFFVAVCVACATVSVPTALALAPTEVEAADTATKTTTFSGTATVETKANGSATVTVTTITDKSGEIIRWEVYDDLDCDLLADHLAGYAYNCVTVYGKSHIMIRRTPVGTTNTTTTYVDGWASVSNGKKTVEVYDGEKLSEKHEITASGVKVTFYTDGKEVATETYTIAVSGTTGTMTVTTTGTMPEQTSIPGAATGVNEAGDNHADAETRATSDGTSSGMTVRDGYYTYSQLKKQATTKIQKKALKTLKKYNTYAKKQGWTRRNYKFGKCTKKKAVIKISFGGWSKGTTNYSIEKLSLVRTAKKAYFKQAGKDGQITGKSLKKLLKDPTRKVSTTTAAGNTDTSSTKVSTKGKTSFSKLKKAAKTSLQKSAVKNLKSFDKLAKKQGYVTRKYKFKSSSSSKVVVAVKYYGKKVKGETYYFNIKFVQNKTEHHWSQGKNASNILDGSVKKLLRHPENY